MVIMKTLSRRRLKQNRGSPSWLIFCCILTNLIYIQANMFGNIQQEGIYE
jgi:hypothetical protein